MFGMFIFGVWSAGVIWWTLKNTRRTREHEPRAQRLAERLELKDAGAPWLLEAPKTEVECERCGGVCNRITHRAYVRPAPTSMPGPGERQSR